jgi:transcription initiation factor TFIIE subunit alpha
VQCQSSTTISTTSTFAMLLNGALLRCGGSSTKPCVTFVYATLFGPALSHPNKQELDTKGYLCPQCKKSFSPLDVDRLVDRASGSFRCDVCSAELVDNEDAERARGAQDRMQRFNAQMRHVRDGLRASEEMIMPAFDVATFVKTHLADAAAERAAAAEGANGSGGSGGRELKIAGMGGTKREDEGVGVVMSLGLDEEEQRAARSAAAEAKKAQNALPTWHLKSTISGDLTALGIAESARAEAVAATAAPSGSNDEILRGLGRSGPSMTPVSQDDLVVEEVKPVTDPTGDCKIAPSCLMS